jgi:hypothetical protein
MFSILLGSYKRWGWRMTCSVWMGIYIIGHKQSRIITCWCPIHNSTLFPHPLDCFGRCPLRPPGGGVWALLNYWESGWGIPGWRSYSLIPSAISIIVPFCPFCPRHVDTFLLRGVSIDLCIKKVASRSKLCLYFQTWWVRRIIWQVIDRRLLQSHNVCECRQRLDFEATF